MSRPIRLMVIAGEVSGDMHAAGLIHAMKQSHPDLECFGIGGDALRAAGMEIIHDAKDMAAIGFTEILPKLGFFIRVFNEMVALAGSRRPDAVILVDYPGFNLRFAKRAHQIGLKVIYYICPQVWAWDRGRIPEMARIIDRLMVIFPFEQKLFAGTGLKVDFVGHPLIDESANARALPIPHLPWRGQPWIAVLPGSRRQTIRRMLPAFYRAGLRVQEKYQNVSFIVPVPSGLIAETITSILRGLSADLSRWQVVIGQTRQVLRTATAAMVSSGTATLETALMGCPMIIAYKMAPLSYFFLRRAVTVEFAGMVNIVAGRSLCQEFIQGNATPRAMADAVIKLLENDADRACMTGGFREVALKLGSSGSSYRAAAAVLQELGV